jgi:hypothetical protein
MKWSRQIAATYTTDFVLDGKTFYPHITLYQAAFPDKNISFVEQQLDALAGQVNPFRVRSEDFISLVGFVFLKFIKSEELVSLHRQIVGLCNPIREGENIPAEVQNLTDPNVPEFIKYSIKTYGSALAMDAFLPHITLSRLKNFSETENARAMLEKKDMAFDVHSIHLANIGPDGTVNEIYKEFPLG